MPKKLIEEDYKDYGEEDLLREILKRLDRILVKAGDRPRKKEFNTTIRCRKCKKRTVDYMDQEINDHNTVYRYSCYNCGEEWTK